MFASAQQRLTHRQPLHAAVWGNPLAAGHIAVADVGLKAQPETSGLLRGEDERLSPVLIEHLVGSLALAMHLVVVDHAADASLLESLEVGGDALAGSLGLAEEPPHLHTGCVLRMVETLSQRCLCLTGIWSFSYLPTIMKNQIYKDIRGN